MRSYIIAWLLITGFLGFEYWALSSAPHWSFFLFLQTKGWLSPNVKFNIIPGRNLSLWLGWIGISLMVLMNVYSLRKRFRFTHNWGKLSLYLNFHIFCGLMGPTLIFFHCGLKVRGLVGISFWSMIVSLTSGIIGRYLYAQLSSQRDDLERGATKAADRMDYLIERAKFKWSKEMRGASIARMLKHVGAREKFVNPFMALGSTLLGDARLLFSEVPVPAGYPAQAKAALTLYAIKKRSAFNLAPFEKLMGYWHAFHFPFAVFMYLAAIIHIISSLIFLGSG